MFAFRAANHFICQEKRLNDLYKRLPEEKLSGIEDAWLLNGANDYGREADDF